MSRVIKFRAWDKKKKKWLFGYDYQNLGGFSLIGEVVLFGELSSISLDKWASGDIDIMQYTGLKDKNSKEIYEGDIVESYFSAPWDEEIPLLIRGQIVYGEPFEGCFCFIDNKADNTQLLYEIGNEIGNGEVVGNIHENSELLKQKK